MDTNVLKQAITKVTGLQVGERNGSWVVKDSEGWRSLTSEEIDSSDLEYEKLISENAVPKIITMRQARLALLKAGLLETITASIGSMPQNVVIEWEYASDVMRDSPTITALASALSLSKEQVDELFIEGAKL
jgi:hypothetical protein